MATNNFMDDKSIGLEDKKNGEAVPFSGDSLLVFLNFSGLAQNLLEKSQI